MDREFIIDLTENEAEYLNEIMPKNHSVQVYEKFSRKRKAEKKLDDMYVAEFSLRPVKKNKKENQHISQKTEKTNHQDNKSRHHQIQTMKCQDKKSNLNIKQDKSLKNNHQSQKVKCQKTYMQDQNEIQTVQLRTSRSSRVSKPTEAYLQFQQQTFKRKVPQRIQPQISNKNYRDTNLSDRKQKNQVNSTLQRKEKDNKDQKQKIELQKYIGQQKEKQHILQKLSQQSVEKIKQSKFQKSFLESDQKIQSTKFQKHYNLRIDPPKKQHFQNEDSQKNVKNIVVQNKNLGFQNLQNLTKDMPKICVNSKEIQNFQRKRSQISGNKHMRVIYNTQQQPLLKRCWRILQKLKGHKSSWPFRHPVNPELQGVPDYFQKIKHPMDLKTIEKNLRNQKYKTQEQFYSHVNLMFQNSYSYNPQTSNYYKLTNSLQTYFKELKSQSYIPKSSGRNSIVEEDDEQNSQYEGQEQIQDEQKQDSKLMKSEQQHDSKSSKYQKQDSKKRNSSHLDKFNMIGNKRPLKVIVTNEGAIKKYPDGQSYNQVNEQNDKTVYQQKEGQQRKQKISQQVIKKRASVRQIEVKDIQKSVKKQQKKKIQEYSNKKINQTQVQKQEKKENQQKKQLRFGYFEPKITLIQRQTLLYDILHIESADIRNKIERFLDQNDEIFKKYKHYRNENYKMNKQESKWQINQQVVNKLQQSQGQTNKLGQAQEQGQSEYDFELRDLDPEHYKLLRAQIDRLMGQDEQNRRILGNEHVQSSYNFYQGQNKVNQ